MITESIKKMNLLKLTGSMLVSVVGVFVAVNTVDDRYAHATDVSKQFQQEDQKQIEIQKQVRSVGIEMRRKQLDDYIFTYEYKVQTKQATPLDKALLDRYKREMQTLPIPQN
jgi:hypothetical protein